MERFASLLIRLEQSRSTLAKVSLIRDYFENTPPEDAAWALFFLSGNKLKRLITGRMLYEWCKELVHLPEWLMQESYSAVGDIAEVVSLLLPEHKEASNNLSLSEWMEQRILPLKGQPTDLIKSAIISYWKVLDTDERFIFNKILSGTMRIGVSHLTTLQALSQALGLSREMLSQKLMGDWFPSADFFNTLKVGEPQNKQSLSPYPFFLAAPLEMPLENLGLPEEWMAEWKWDGIRAQGIHRQGQIAIWSRGNELINIQLPELMEALSTLPNDSVIDGEILAYKDGQPLPFAQLQKRLGRKKVSSKMIDEIPLVFMIYDLLEYEGVDLRKNPLHQRREIMARFDTLHLKLKISPLISFQEWDELIAARESAKSNCTEGLMLKKKSSAYGIGRKRGSWWKFKLDAKTIDAVLLYAQTGHGWRANLYTDYTFGVWNEGQLVPIAKAYSGLSQEEIFEVDRWIRKNTVEKFGPVRSVEPKLVFEIAFEGIQESKRHKAGIALRFPRIHRWRQDKSADECDSLAQIKEEFLNKK